MKKLPFIIGIPAVAIALVLGGAMLWKLKNQTVGTVNQLPGAFESSGTKPSNPFSALFGSKVAPTPTPASSADLNKELLTVEDDGGAADINSLKSEASGL